MMELVFSFIFGFAVSHMLYEIKHRTEEYKSGRTEMVNAIEMQSKAKRQYHQGYRHMVKWGFLTIVGWLTLLVVFAFIIMSV